MKEQLSIRTIVPKNILNAIEIAFENGEQLTNFTTAFKYSLNAGQLSITNDEATILLDSFVR